MPPLETLKRGSASKEGSLLNMFIAQHKDPLYFRDSVIYSTQHPHRCPLLAQLSCWHAGAPCAIKGDSLHPQVSLSLSLHQPHSAEGGRAAGKKDSEHCLHLTLWPLKRGSLLCLKKNREYIKCTAAGLPKGTWRSLHPFLLTRSSAWL